VGFQELDDSSERQAEDIYTARLKYFDEGNSIGKELVDAYVVDRRVYYNEKDEMRSNLRLGAVFFVVTCLLDWYICTI
jgi:hypothetical protein